MPKIESEAKVARGKVVRLRELIGQPVRVVLLIPTDARGQQVTESGQLAGVEVNGDVWLRCTSDGADYYKLLSARFIVSIAAPCDGAALPPADAVMQFLTPAPIETLRVNVEAICPSCGVMHQVSGDVSSYRVDAEGRIRVLCRQCSPKKRRPADEATPAPPAADAPSREATDAPAADAPSRAVTDAPAADAPSRAATDAPAADAPVETTVPAPP